MTGVHADAMMRSGDAVVATTGAAVAEVDAAFRTPGALQRILPTPFGEMPGETFARLLAFDFGAARLVAAARTIALNV